MNRALFRYGMTLATFAVMTFAIAHVSQAATYVTWWGTSIWWGGKVQTTVNYSQDTFYSVTIQNVFAKYDNSQGHAPISASKLRIYDGYGGWPVNVCKSLWPEGEAGGPMVTDYWTINSTYYKHGNSVQVLNGASTSGNCGVGFSGWRVKFLTSYIQQQFTE